MTQPELRTPRVRLIEPHLTAHGPLWLDFIAGAFARHCDELTVIHPDHPSYDGLEAARTRWRAMGHADIHLEPVALPEGRDRFPTAWASERASEPGVDLSLITFLDQSIWGPRTLSFDAEAGRPAIWGIWFWLVDPRGRVRRLVRRAFDPRVQWEVRSLGIQRRPPRWLDGVFVADEEAPNRILLDRPIQVLPDAVGTGSRDEREALRRRLDLPEAPTLFLHIGPDHDRKGLDDVMRAWRDAPTEAVLLRAGTVEAKRREKLAELVSRGRAVHLDYWIPEEDISAVVRAADWMLLPYRYHEGPSGLLSSAAAAQRPVIAPDFGYLGRRLREHRIGRVYAHGSVRGLADAVMRACADGIDPYREALDSYAASQSLGRFESALLAPFIPTRVTARDPEVTLPAFAKPDGG